MLDLYIILHYNIFINKRENYMNYMNNINKENIEYLLSEVNAFTREIAACDKDEDSTLEKYIKIDEDMHKKILIDFLHHLIAKNSDELNYDEESALHNLLR